MKNDNIEENEIKAFLKKHHWTNKKLAQELSLSESQIRRLKTNKKYSNNITLENHIKLQLIDDYLCLEKS